jgi:hypothetical protein
MSTRVPRGLHKSGVPAEIVWQDVVLPIPGTFFHNCGQTLRSLDQGTRSTFGSTDSQGFSCQCHCAHCAHCHSLHKRPVKSEAKAGTRREACVRPCLNSLQMTTSTLKSHGSTEQTPGQPCPGLCLYEERACVFQDRLSGPTNGGRAGGPSLGIVACVIGLAHAAWAQAGPAWARAARVALPPASAALLCHQVMCQQPVAQIIHLRMWNAVQACHTFMNEMGAPFHLAVILLMTAQ